jgi:steroid delta-isomerase-like uncharacterized protein
MSTEDNKALVRRVMEEAMNNGNLASADQLVATDYVYRAPGSPELRGPEGLKQNVMLYRNAFPNVHLAIDEMTAEDDRVVVCWTASGTHQGALMGIPPTGSSVSGIKGITVARCAAGKMVESTDVFDMLGILQQIGAVPSTLDRSP